MVPISATNKKVKNGKNFDEDSDESQVEDGSQVCLSTQGPGKLSVLTCPPLVVIAIQLTLVTTPYLVFNWF